MTSTIRSTLPRSLNRLMKPLDPTWTTTRLVTGREDGTLRSEAFGRVVKPGYTVTKVPYVAFRTVTLRTTATGEWAPPNGGMLSIPAILMESEAPAATFPGLLQPSVPLVPVRVSQARAGVTPVNWAPVVDWNQPSTSTATLTDPTLFQTLTVHAAPLQAAGTLTITRLGTVADLSTLTFETIGRELEPG